jgi:hypothetical protein
MSENERLAARLTSIAAALNPKANAPPPRIVRTVSPEQVTAAFAFLQNSEGGQAVCVIFNAVLDTLISHKEVLDALKKANAELKAQLATCLKDAGVWRDGRTYKLADQVTFRGVPWIAQRETSTRPGSDDSWRMTTKSEGHR